MGKRKQSRKVYGKSAHYWPVEMQPLLVAAALIDVILETCEKARLVYREVKDAWGLPGCQIALGEVKLPLKDILALAEGNQGVQLPDTLLEIYSRHKDGSDCQYLIGRINEFIKVGFNRAQGKQKVLPCNASWLCVAVGLRALVDFSVDRPDWETYKLLEFGGKSYDLSTIFEGEYRNRVHRRKVGQYKNFGLDLHHDEKFKNIAWYWYQCRVVYSGPEEFCREYLLETGIELRPENVDREIGECDIVTGYPRRNLMD